MKLEKLKLSELKEHPKNYNRHPDTQLTELESSLNQFEQFKNIVVWKGFIIAGNGLAMAAKQRGDKHIYAVVRDDLTEQQAIALIAADNLSANLALPDEQSLKRLLSEFESPIDIPGVTDDFLDRVFPEEIDIDQFFEDSEDEPEEKKPKTVKCPDCGREIEI